MLTSLTANRAAGKFVLGALVIVLLAGCGRKPGDVEAPETATHSTYPKTYPPMDGN